MRVLEMTKYKLNLELCFDDPDGVVARDVRCVKLKTFFINLDKNNNILREILKNTT